MAVCLLPEQIKNFKEALKKRRIEIADLLNMTSEARTELLREYAGANAKDVNLLFEQKLVLKNKVRGLQNWASKVGEIGRYDPTKKAQIDQALKEFREKQMERMFDPKQEEAFLSDLAEKKLGTQITRSEAKQVFDFTRKTGQLREAYNEQTNSWKSEPARLEYGSSKVSMDRYVKNLKGEEPQYPLKNPFKAKGVVEKLEVVGTDLKTLFNVVADNSRAIVASIDNSLWGNQGIGVMFNPKFTGIWAKNFVKSLSDIYQVLRKGGSRGDEILDAVRADMYSRPNYMNGRYTTKTKGTSKLDINVVEEEFPTSLPSKIPVFGRAFKASEVAYEAGAMRLRMDVADKMYEMRAKNGVDMTDPVEIGSTNAIVNSMTGRGRIGAFERASRQINTAVFSIRFAKASFDILTAHMFSKISPKAKIVAAKNLLSIIATMGTVLTIAKTIDPKSTDFDPRSSKFGEIYGMNITGGLGGFLTLFARIMTQSTKSARTGIVTELGGGFGVPDGMDIFWNFMGNKASPLFSVIRDMVKQETFEREKPTIINSLASLTTPISISNMIDLSEDPNVLLFLIGSSLALIGFDAGDYTQKTNWDKNITNEFQQFKDAVGEKEFKKANDRYNDEFNDWFDSIKHGDTYKDSSDDVKQRLLMNKKREIKKQIFKDYSFVKAKEEEKEPLPKL